MSSVLSDAIMRTVISCVVCLFLLLSLVHIAHGWGKQKWVSRSCRAMLNVLGGSALLVEAGSTGFIRYKPVRFHQNYWKKCRTQQAMKYRTANGSCNHFFNRGAANTPFTRFLPPLYGDGLCSPRTHGKDGFPLPSATDVSRLVHTQQSATMRHTVMFVQWGQFTDHDLALTLVPTTRGKTVKCCGPGGTIAVHPVHPDCFPIILSDEDANKRFKGKCMNMVRSLPARNVYYGHQTVPREQVNEPTHFLDGSNIYGSSLQVQIQLRENRDRSPPGAKLRTERNGLLPSTGDSDCIHRAEDYCFLAGDIRVNVQPGLTAIHIMWVRLHNLVVDGLKDVFSDDEELFQEARKIVVAVYQHIHYDEWLPHVVGPRPVLPLRYRLYSFIRKVKLSRYSYAVDPRIMNEFATAAFRFGHSMLPGHLVVKEKSHKFRDLFFKPDLIFDDYDAVVEALVSPNNSALTTDRFIVDDLTEHLFEPPTQINDTSSRGLDLAALNIQRGRDHGLRPYNDYRKKCGVGERIRHFDEFGEAGKILKSLYKSVDDIDLFVGGLLENTKPGAAVGPTFACIIAKQFHALKYGDKFFFETDRQPGRLTAEQLKAIRHVTFAHVICLTANLTQVPEKVFFSGSTLVKCKKLREEFLDFSLWKTS